MKEVIGKPFLVTCHLECDHTNFQNICLLMLIFAPHSLIITAKSYILLLAARYLESKYGKYEEREITT